MMAIGLSKHQALNADPKAIQQINFTGVIEKRTKMNRGREGPSICVRSHFLKK